MAWYTRSELATLLGKHRSFISTYVSRGKLIMSGDVVDSDLKLNAEFIQKWLQIKSEKEDTDTPKETEKKKYSTQNKKHSEPKQLVLEPPNVIPVVVDPENSISALDRKKALADIALKESRNRINLLDEAKKRAENIPTEIVSAVIATLGQQFQSAYKAGSESLMMELTHKYKIPPEGVASLKIKLTTLINKSHDNAIREAKMQIKKVVIEISEGVETQEEESND